MEAGFELFDHTADIGIRVFAPTLDGLVPASRDGLYAVIGDLVPGRTAPPLRLDLQGEDPAGPLRDFLAELLRRFEVGAEVCTTLSTLTFGSNRLAVHGGMHALDPERSVFFREVKAVTYHELAVREIPGGYEARFIVDI